MEHEDSNDFNKVYKEKEEFFGHPYRELQDYFSSFKKGTVLDLGCGQGRDSIFFASLGHKVTAVDSSEVAIKQMMEKSQEIKGVVADLFEFKSDDKFDIILFDMLLHTFDYEKQRELLKKYSKNLSEKGILCIIFPDDMKRDHFQKILESLELKFLVKDTITVKDTPKIPGESTDFTFVMTIIQL